MPDIVTIITLVAFGVILIINLFVRVRVLQNYRILVKNQIEFDKEHMWDMSKLKAEILPKYPKFEKNIVAFVRGIQISRYCNFALVIIVSVFVFLLMFNK
ncbi:MAG: hypothetical protein MK212_16855 [Saprospiraceae bacterium]|nr:hypothetical protein [Saprospiraceae bacterium]